MASSLIVLLARPVWVAPVVAKPIDLTPKFEAGAEVHYVSRSTIQQDVRVAPAGVAEQMAIRTEAGMTVAVTDVAGDGSAGIEWRLRYVAISTDAAIPGIDQMLDYDSRDPRQSISPLGALFSRMIDKPVTARVDASGKVMDFQGPDTSTMVGPLGALAQRFFSKQAFEQLPIFVTGGAPAPAKVRSTWSARTTLEMPLGVGSLELAQDFKFMRIRPRQKTALIEMTGTVTKGAAQASANPGLVPLDLGSALDVDNGTLSGQYVWDFAAGQLVAAETQVKLEISLHTPLGHMQLEQNVSTTVKRATPQEVGLIEEPWRREARRNGAP
ncbi:MAG: hypothetical protein ACYSUI_11765 [Planctomycetota bacterium]|jgi:hypothetical protein